MDQSELQTHISNGTLVQAAVELEAQRAALQEKNNVQELAEATNDLAVVYLMQDETVKARTLFGEAQQLFIEANDAAGQGRATGNLAQLEERNGNADAAAALYMQAADLLHEGGSFADEYTTRRRLSRYYLTHGGTMMALNETVHALRVKPNAGAWDKFQIWMYSIPFALLGIKT